MGLLLLLMLMLLLWLAVRLYFFVAFPSFVGAVVLLLLPLVILLLLLLMLAGAGTSTYWVTLEAVASGWMATSVIISENSSVLMQNCWTSDVIRLIFSKSSQNSESRVRNMSSGIRPVSLTPWFWWLDSSAGLADCNTVWWFSNRVAPRDGSLNVIVPFLKRENY